VDSFEKFESQVRTYCRAFPAVFSNAKGDFLYDETGKEYIDFFAGAGTMNYGHNNPIITTAIIEYVQRNGIIHSLDKFTTAKREFLETFNSVIMQPRNLRYKIQFCGPTGANAVEAALKLARKFALQRWLFYKYYGCSVYAIRWVSWCGRGYGTNLAKIPY
jgi:diaminobutyrate-2-oxoglutarate transaminase